MIYELVACSCKAYNYCNAFPVWLCSHVGNVLFDTLYSIKYSCLETFNLLLSYFLNIFANSFGKWLEEAIFPLKNNKKQKQT